MMKKDKKIVICAGGTGGHVFPSIALYEKLKKNYHFFFLTDRRCEYIFKDYDVNYNLLKVNYFNKNIFLWPKTLVQIIKSIIFCFKLFKKEKPKLVIGFGGYVSFPGIISAKILNISTIIHEQNAVMGKANRILSIISNYIALTFKETRFCSLSRKVVHTGLPIRNSFFNEHNKLIKKSKKQILILGGSQGAKVFSKIVPKIIRKLNSELRNKIVIKQQALENDIKDLEKIYNEIRVSHQLKKFFKNINKEMVNADLIISRCGASTLSELELFNTPIFLFPLPHSKNNHQLENAKKFLAPHGSIIFDEEEFNESKFLSGLNEIILEKNKKTNYRKKLKRNDTFQNLIQTILSSENDSEKI